MTLGKWDFPCHRQAICFAFNGENWGVQREPSYLRSHIFTRLTGVCDPLRSVNTLSMQARQNAVS
jgi:hypothetical protein